MRELNREESVTPFQITEFITTQASNSDLVYICNNFPNLKYLELVGGTISDLTPIIVLKRLTALVLSYNEITDIAPLAELTDLIKLNLSQNRVVDTTPLAGLIELSKLRLDYNKIENIRPLLGLPCLTSVDLSCNPVSDSKATDKLKERCVVWTTSLRQ